MVILGLLVLVAIFAPLIAPYDPDKVLIGVEKIKMRQAPCIHLLGCPPDQPQHILGIDGNVRDFFSRVVYGSRVSLMVGFTTVGFAIVIGTMLGAVAGFAGGMGRQRDHAHHGCAAGVPGAAAGHRHRHACWARG